MGSKGADAPDYTPMERASAESARVMSELGNRQIDFSQRMYDENKPTLDKIAAGQIAAQDEQLTQARDYYDYNKSTFRPVEQQLVADAQNFNSRAYQEQLASKAAADAGLAFGQTQASNQRAMGAMGVNPASGKFAGMNNASSLGLAAQRAGAMTNARQGAEQMGHARMLDAAGLGRGLSGASTAAYGASVNAGTSGANSTQTGGQTFQTGFSSGAGMIGQGQTMNLNGMGNVLNAQTSVYAADANKPGWMGELGGLLGGGAAMYGAYNQNGSDRRLKENIVEVGVDQRTALTLYEFNYIADPARRYIGVMADEVELSYPEAVSVGEDGYKMVHYGMLGIEMKEVV